MCDPTAIAALSTIVQYGEQSAAAQANTENANKALVNDIRQLNLRQRQEEEAEVQRDFDTNLQTARDVSTAMTASGESGASGLSVDALVSDIIRQNLFDDTKADSNLDMTLAQIDMEKEGAQTARQSRINQVPYPSFAASALQIGGSMYEGGYFDNTPFQKTS